MKTIVSFLVLASVAPLCFAADPERPPPLTFDKHIDYLKWYDEFASQGRDPKDNALSEYLKLCSGESSTGGLDEPKGDAARQFELAQERSWNGKDFPQLKAYLDQNKSFLSLFEKVTQIHYFWHTLKPGSSTLMGIDHPLFYCCGNASKALIAEGWMRDDRQPTRMIANWQTILACARQFAQDPLDISHSFSSGLRRFVYRQACLAVQEDIIKGKNALRAISSLQEFDPGPSDMTRAVIALWGASLDTLQSTNSPEKFDVKHWATTCKPIADRLDIFFPKLAEAVTGPIEGARLKRVRELCRSSAPTRKRDRFSALMLIDYSMTYESELRTDVWRRGTLLVLAIHAYKYKTKHWPAKLDELEIEKLKTLRIDPYSGKDFVYKVSKDGPVLYSIGSEGKDDGGRHDPKWGEGDRGGDYVFWPVQKE